MLGLRHGHAVAGNDDDVLGLASISAVSAAPTGTTSPAGCSPPFAAGCAAAGAEAAGDDAEEVAVHRAAHDVRQDRAGRADQRADDDQQVVAEHEARGRRGPARVAVEHRDDHRHVGAADGHDHVHAEQQRDHGHEDERHHAGLDGLGAQELPTEPDHEQQAGQVEPVPAGQQQRLAADPRRQLAEGDQRAGEGDGADQDADVDLHLVDRFLGRRREHRRRVDVAGEADQARGQADEAVHQRDQFGHLRHLHLLRRVQTDGSADDERADDPRVARRRDARPQHGREHGKGHADHAEDVAATRGLGMREPSQAQDEQDRRADVGNDGQACGHVRSPVTCGTSPACAASPRSRRTC